MPKETKEKILIKGTAVVNVPEKVINDDGNLVKTLTKKGNIKKDVIIFKDDNYEDDKISIYKKGVADYPKSKEEKKIQRDLEKGYREYKKYMKYLKTAPENIKSLYNKIYDSDGKALNYWKKKYSVSYYSNKENENDNEFFKFLYKLLPKNIQNSIDEGIENKKKKKENFNSFYLEFRHPSVGLPDENWNNYNFKFKKE